MGGTALPFAYLGCTVGGAILVTRAAAAIAPREALALGAPDASVTILHYASPTSQHCARWHQGVFPEIRSRFIETGRVRFVLLEVVTPPERVAEDCFLVARAAGRSHYFALLASIFAKWLELRESDYADGLGDHLEILRAIAEAHGLSEGAFATALCDTRAREALKARAYRHSWCEGVSGTPSFVVGNRYFGGYEPVDILAAAIEEAERAATQAL